jgi:RimJ/RimL family protein N-acetyltransferase
MVTPDLFADAFEDTPARSARLMLRRPERHDAAALAALANDRSIADNTARVPHPYTLADAEAFIAAAARSGRRPALLAFRAEAPGELVGAVGLDGEGIASGELGYWVGAPHRGQGYATEMVRLVVDLAFTAGASRLEASCRVTNGASRRVLHKCGFQWRGVGLVKSVGFGGAFPADRFVLDRGAWESLRAWGAAPLARGDGGAALRARCA